MVRVMSRIFDRKRTDYVHIYHKDRNSLGIFRIDNRSS